MPRTIQQTVYKFDELSARAKEKAREWWRNCESSDFGAHGEIYEPAETAAQILGISFRQTTVKLHSGMTRLEPDIRWEGFHMPGCGACFVGSYHFRKNAAEKIRAEWPQDEKLHAIADELKAIQAGYRVANGKFLEVLIDQDGRSVHATSMRVTVLEADGAEVEDGDVIERVRWAMINFANWIFDGFEAEYDYRMSDESADESMVCNDYEFDEDGDRV